MGSFEEHPLGSSAATAEMPYGRRLLPVQIDYVAAVDPGRAIALLPRNEDDLTQGFFPLTFAAFSRAIDRLAFLLEPQLAKLDLQLPVSDAVTGLWNKAPVVGYLGVDDLRNNMVVVALLKSGYCVRTIRAVCGCC